MRFIDMYPKDRFYAAEFKGKPVTLTFRETDPPTDPVTHELLGKGGPSEKMMPVWHFNETPKKLPAVVTNGVCARAIMQTVVGKVEGDDSNNWVGHKITLYPAPDPSGMSDDGLCIRVLGSPELKKPLVFTAQIGCTKKTFTLKPTGNGKAAVGVAGVAVNADTGEVTQPGEALPVFDRFTGTDDDFAFDDDAPGTVQEAAGCAPTPEASTDPSEAVSDADGPIPGMDAQAFAEAREPAPTLLRPVKVSATQVASIGRLRKSSGIYEAEFAALLDSYGADAVGELSKENAGYVIQALELREAEK